MNQPREARAKSAPPRFRAARVLPVSHASRSDVTKGGRRHLEILALAALVIVFLWDPRLLAPGSFIGGEDVELGHYWYKTYLKERLQGLALPLWAPQFFGGHPFLAYPEMCVFYPCLLYTSPSPRD